MGILKEFKEKSKKLQRRIVLAEGFDERTISAAIQVIKEKIAKLVILGNEESIKSALIQGGLKDADIDNDNLKIIDPINSSDLKEYTLKYYLLRKDKGMTEEEASLSMKNPLFFGAMLIKEGNADGMVAGAANTTSDVLRAALRIIGVKKGIKTVSSCFIMVMPTKKFGSDGVLLFADSAVNPDPTAEMLVDIALSTAENCRQLLGIEPKIALLSFSTKGSATTPSTEKVVCATKLLQESFPDLLIDGEMQLDAAIIPDVAKRKAPDSKIAGQANILIFPNLDAGNIGYKLVERFSNAEAIGPIIQGLCSPVNDLSRGCSSEDIVNVVAITSVQVK